MLLPRMLWISWPKKTSKLFRDLTEDGIRAVALPRGGLLVSILVLPFTIPVLIFGVSATYAAVEDPAPFLPPFMILAALTLLFAALGPLAAAGALRQSSD